MFQTLQIYTDDLVTLDTELQGITAPYFEPFSFHLQREVIDVPLAFENIIPSPFVIQDLPFSQFGEVWEEKVYGMIELEEMKQLPTQEKTHLIYEWYTQKTPINGLVLLMYQLNKSIPGLIKSMKLTNRPEFWQDEEDLDIFELRIGHQQVTLKQQDSTTVVSFSDYVQGIKESLMKETQQDHPFGLKVAFAKTLNDLFPDDKQVMILYNDYFNKKYLLENPHLTTLHPERFTHRPFQYISPNERAFTFWDDREETYRIRTHQMLRVNHGDIPVFEIPYLEDYDPNNESDERDEFVQFSFRDMEDLRTFIEEEDIDPESYLNLSLIVFMPWLTHRPFKIVTLDFFKEDDRNMEEYTYRCGNYSISGTLRHILDTLINDQGEPEDEDDAGIIDTLRSIENPYDLQFFAQHTLEWDTFDHIHLFPQGGVDKNKSLREHPLGEYYAMI